MLSSASPEFMKSAIASLNEPVVSCDAGLMLCVQYGAVRTMVIVTIERADAKDNKPFFIEFKSLSIKYSIADGSKICNHTHILRMEKPNYTGFSATEYFFTAHLKIKNRLCSQ